MQNLKIINDNINKICKIVILIPFNDKIFFLIQQ